MLQPVPAGGIWDWLTGKSKKAEAPLEPRVPDAFVPRSEPAAPTQPVVYADAQVESLCRAVKVQASASTAAMQVAQAPLGLPGIALELVKQGTNDKEKSRVALAALQHLQAEQVPGPWAFGQNLLESVPQPHHRAAVAQIILASNASEAAGLAGLGLACAQALDGTFDAGPVSGIGQRALAQLDTPAARLGLELSRAVKHDYQRVAIHEVFLRNIESPDLPALGLAAANTLDKSYSTAERAAVGRVLIEKLAADPVRSLARELQGAVAHDYQRLPIQELVLTNLDKSSRVELAALGLQAATTLDLSYSTKERAAVGRLMVDRLGDTPILALTRQMADAVHHDYQRIPLYERALANPESSTSRDLAEHGQAMLATLDPSYSTKERAAASRVLLERLKSFPETGTIAELGLLMVGEVSHDYQRVGIADSVMKSIVGGQSSELSVAEQAMGTLDATYSAQDLSRVAMAVLQRTGNADADLVLEAMRAVKHDYQRCAMASVIFEHLLAPDPPPFSQLARGLMGAFDLNYSAADAVSVGRVLSRRYSDPRARGHLDAALSQPHDYQRAAALREAFGAIQGIDDDIAQIKNMANAITGQAPTSTVVEQEGAVLVGGVRLRVRPRDVESQPARAPEN